MKRLLLLFTLILLSSFCFADYTYYAPTELDNKLIMMGETSKASCGILTCDYQYSIRNDDNVSHTIDIVPYFDTTPDMQIEVNEITYELIKYKNTYCAKYDTLTYDENKEEYKVCSKYDKEDANYIKETIGSPLTKDSTKTPKDSKDISASKFKGKAYPKTTIVSSIAPNEIKYYQITFTPSNKSGELILTTTSETNNKIKGSLDPDYNLLSSLIYYYALDANTGIYTLDSKVSNGAQYKGTSKDGGVGSGIINKGGTFTTTTGSILSIYNESSLDFMTAANATFSMSFWAKTTTASGYFTSKQGTTATGFHIAMGGANTLEYQEATNGSNYRYYKASVPGGLNNNVWHNIIVTSNAGTITTYVDTNNVTAAWITAGTYTNGNNDNNLWMGGRGADGAYPIAGNMDEIGIWDRALTTAEVAALYNGGAGFAYPFSSGTTSCTYGGSGNWQVNLADNCNLTTDTNIGNNLFTTIGTGTLKINAWIYDNYTVLTGNPITLLGKGFKHY